MAEETSERPWHLPARAGEAKGVTDRWEGFEITQPDGAEPVKLTDNEFKALSHISAGKSVLGASRLTGLSQERIHELIALRHDPNVEVREKYIRAAEDRIMDLQLDTLEMAQRELLRRIEEEGPDLKTSDLVKAADQAQTAIGKRRGWGEQASGEGVGMNALARALAEIGGGEATISVSVKRSDAAASAKPVN